MEIETLDQLAKAFGRKKDAAAWFGVTPSAFSQWRYVPARHHRRLLEHAKRRKWNLADDVFTDVPDPRDVG